MTVSPLVFGLGAAAATLLGGLLALRLKHRLVLILGVAAGIVLGVAVFDLVPEALELGRGSWRAHTLIACMAMGLCLYRLLDRGFSRAGWMPQRWRAHLGPATLAAHSLMDGLGIGLAFQIDSRAGVLVALAVLTHDIADGVNMVSLCLAARSEGAARRWLALNSIAPVVGVLLGMHVQVPRSILALLIAGFAGVFFHIGACELLPRSYALAPRLRTTFFSLCGMALMFVVTSVAR